MASIIKSDNGVSSGITGIVQSADSSGQLALQTTTSGGTATTAVTIDNSQNVGIQTTPSAWSANRPALELGGSVQGTIAFNGNNTNGGLITYNTYYNGSATVYKNTGYACNYIIGSSGSHVWTVAPSGTAGNAVSSTQAMTLDASSNLLVGDTTNTGNLTRLYVKADGTHGAATFAVPSTGSYTQIFFTNPNGNVGSISTSGSTTSYITSSDYRLKENIAPMTGALSIVAQLKPVTYNWKIDGSSGQGFIAHELQAVVPDCVTGEKDAVDSEGKPVYQGIDTSFLVATLTSAIQELAAQVTSLQAKVDSQATTIATLQNKIGA